LVTDYHLQQIAQQKMMKLMLKHETELMDLRVEKETWDDQQNKLRENLTELSSKFSVANSELINEK
jgi:hypothetical protein